MFGRPTLSRRVAQLESEVASIRRLYEKTLDYSMSDPETALMNARKAAEAVCSRVFEHKVGKPPKNLTLQPLIEKLSQLDAVPEQILVALRTIQSYGNFGSHHQAGEPQSITAEFAQPCLQALGTVVQWYFQQFGHELHVATLGASRNAVRARARPPVESLLFPPSPHMIAAAAVFWAFSITGIWLYLHRSVSPDAAAAKLPPVPRASVSLHEAQSTQPIPAANPPSPLESAPAATNELPRIAVLQFAPSAGDDHSSLGQGISTIVTTRLVQSGMFVVVERERLDEVIAELDLSQTKKFDSSQVARIGKLLGARQLVLGSYFRIGEKLRIDARFVDAETGSVICTADFNGSPDKIDIATDGLCEALISQHPDQPRLAPHIIRTDNGRLFDTREKRFLDGRPGGF